MSVPLPGYGYSICDDLWFSRNFYFDLAGNCFGSVLEEEVFDNADCRTDAPELSILDKRRVIEIQRMEQDFDCKVDQTVRRELNVENLDARRKLVHQPVRTGLEIVCVGYQGPQIYIYPDQTRKGERLGRLRPDDILSLSHVEKLQDGRLIRFVYRIIRAESEIGILGWIKASSLQPFFTEDTCKRLIF